MQRDDVASLVELGSILVQRGEYRRAVVCLEAASRTDPESTDCLNQLALAHLGAGNPEAAAQCCEKAVTRHPNCAAFWQLLGKIYVENLDRLDDALRCFRRAIDLCPGDIENYQLAAQCFLNNDGPESTIVRLCNVLSSDVDPLNVRRGVGRALLNTGWYEKALTVFHGIVDESPQDAFSLRSLGELYSGLHDMDSAGIYLEQAVAAAPRERVVVLSYLLRLGRIGEMERARDFYRSTLRDLTIHFDTPPSAVVWRGEDVRGKRLRLIVGDIYYGDAIQFVRLARVPRELGATVIVQGPKRIASLLRKVPGVDYVMAPRDAGPPFDYSAAAFWTLFELSIPFEEIVGTTPYMHSQPELRECWRRRFQSTPGFKIGIAWRGSAFNRANRYACRSMPLEELRTLASIPGVKLYSLQTGPGCEELTHAREPFPAVDLRPDFENTAAVIDELDLVVTVDTSIAHLAGALDRPVFVMLPYDACFRWMLDRNDTPWYRNMRLFRQSKPGDWCGVVADVKNAIEKRVPFEEAV